MCVYYVIPSSADLPDIQHIIVNGNSAVTGIIDLVCIYYSVPVSAITWFHDESSLTNGIDGVSIYSHDEVSFLLRSQLTSTSGGTYACTATNTVGSASASVEVIIQGKPPPPPPHTPSHLTHTTQFPLLPPPT